MGIPFHSTESLQPQYLTHSFLSLSLTPYLIKSTDATDRTACLIYSAYLNPDRPCLPYPPSHSDPSRKPSRSRRSRMRRRRRSRLRNKLRQEEEVRVLMRSKGEDSSFLRSEDL